MNRGAWGACNTPVNLQPQTLTAWGCYNSVSQILGLGAVPPAGPFRARLGGPAGGSSPTPPPRPCWRLRARVRVRAPSRQHAGSPPGRGRPTPAPTRAPPVLLASACPAPAACPQPPPWPPPGTPCVRSGSARRASPARPPLFYCRWVNTWWRGLRLVLICTQVGHPSAAGRSFMSWSIGRLSRLCASCHSLRVSALDVPLMSAAWPLRCWLVGTPPTALLTAILL